MKLYVGNLGDDGNVASTDLKPLFEQYGAVTECECIKNYAFVHMDDENAASEAVRNLNGHSIKGRPIKVEKSESKGPRKPSQKLFIGNIAEGTTNEELKAVFERFAGVLEADVIKNYGFVHIDADAGRQKINEIIRELNGYNLNGSNIRVQMSTSGVRQKPGMSGDQCYSGYGGGRGGGRGGPMRNQPPYGNRGGPGGYNRDPYPPPPPPSYMRERMDGYGGYGGGSGGGYGGYGGHGGHGGYGGHGGSRGMEARNDPYARGGDPMGGPGGSMYDRRPAHPNSGPSGGRGDMGGPGPMRGPDPYASRGGDPYGSMNNGSYGSDYSQAAYSTGAGSAPAYSTGYGAAANPGGASSDMYSRRSPGPMGGNRGGAGSYGGPPPPRGGPPQGYSSGAPPLPAPVSGSAGSSYGSASYSGGYGGGMY